MHLERDRNVVMRKLREAGYTEPEAQEALDEQQGDLDHAFDYLSAKFNVPSAAVLPCLAKEICFKKNNEQLREESLKTTFVQVLETTRRQKRVNRALNRLLRQQQRELRIGVSSTSASGSDSDSDSLQPQQQNEPCDTVARAPEEPAEGIRPVYEVTAADAMTSFLQEEQVIGEHSDSEEYEPDVDGEAEEDAVLVETRSATVRSLKKRRFFRALRRLGGRIVRFVRRLFAPKPKPPPPPPPPPPPKAAPPPPPAPTPPPPKEEKAEESSEESSEMNLNNLNLQPVVYDPEKLQSTKNVDIRESPQEASHPSDVHTNTNTPDQDAGDGQSGQQSSERSDEEQSERSDEEESSEDLDKRPRKTEEDFVRTMMNRIVCQQTEVTKLGPPAWLRNSLKWLAIRKKTEKPQSRRPEESWPPNVPVRQKLVNGIYRPEWEVPPDHTSTPIAATRPPTPMPNSLGMVPGPPPDPVQQGQTTGEQTQAQTQTQTQTTETPMH